MGYEYDVFLSYFRGASAGPDGVELEKPGRWVQEVFYPQLKQALPLARRKPSLFYDEEIDTGSRWREDLRDALHRSRCMLAVWSIPYFSESIWCRSEWQTVLKREEHVEKQTGKRPNLVYPVVFWDGNYFDPEARERKGKHDMKEYSSLLPADVGLQAHHDFRKEVQRMCDDLSKFIDRTPDWDPSWPTMEMPPLGPPDIPLGSNG